jgi:sulfopyruvate decarboxylase TPP-binding subunit
VEPELASKLVNGLRSAGINFVTYLPETRLSQILPLMREDGSFQLAPVASEAEGVSIAAGASLGGKQVACYMEGTGVFVSTYNLLTVAERFGVPMLLLVSYVGSAADKRNSFLYVRRGTRMIPVLEALGIEYQILTDGDNLETRIKNAVRMMHALKLPVVLLFTGEFTT